MTETTRRCCHSSIQYSILDGRPIAILSSSSSSFGDSSSRDLTHAYSIVRSRNILVLLLLIAPTRVYIENRRFRGREGRMLMGNRWGVESMDDRLGTRKRQATRRLQLALRVEVGVLLTFIICRCRDMIDLAQDISLWSIRVAYAYREPRSKLPVAPASTGHRLFLHASESVPRSLQRIIRPIHG